MHVKLEKCIPVTSAILWVFLAWIRYKHFGFEFEFEHSTHTHTQILLYTHTQVCVDVYYCVKMFQLKNLITCSCVFERKSIYVVHQYHCFGMMGKKCLLFHIFHTYNLLRLPLQVETHCEACWWKVRVCGAWDIKVEIRQTNPVPPPPTVHLSIWHHHSQLLCREKQCLA